MPTIVSGREPNGKHEYALIFFSRSSNVSLLFVMDEKKHLGFCLLAKCMCVFECKGINI